MKNTIFFLLILTGIMACNNKRNNVEVTKYSIDQFYKNLSVYGGQFSYDENRLLVTSNESDIFNVWSIPIDGSAKKQLTKSTDESFFAVSYFPEDNRFLFTHDFGGDENDHLFLQNEDGSVSDLTPWEASKSGFAGWARDFKSFGIISNKRDPKFFDLYEVSLEDFTPVLVFENNEGLDIGAISDNKKYLALVQNLTTNNNEMYLYNLETKEKKHISAHEGDATFSPQFFDNASAKLYYLSNVDGEFTSAKSYNISTGEVENVWKTDWDIMYMYDSFNEKFRVFGVNEDARTKVYMTDLGKGESVDLPEFEGGNVTSVSISKSEKNVRLTVGASTSPSNIYIYNLESKELKKLTNTLNPQINEADLVNAEVIRYASYDGLEIPSILLKPKMANKRNKVPALVWVHGGPGGQSRVGYSAFMQYLVNHGYAILAVNNRGSSGYGKTFYKMDDKKHGDADLKDCVKAKAYFETLGWVDMNKIGIIGGSYGGYMVMAALAFEPEAFEVGVNIFGVTNWLRTLKSIPPYWESVRKALYEELGDPFTDDSVRLYNISPLFHAQNVTKPLMVLQGANDPRVLQVESDEIVEKVKANGVPVEYVLFPDEGHGFMKKENEIKGYGQVLKFLDTYLKKEVAE
jgi:dipeptidyl aminopeptidase/acylaminoacyl peptidase